MTFYICAFVFYMYVRIAHSLDLGKSYIWYGIYLLCVEVLGFTTTIIYGLNLLWNPVIEQFPEDPESPGKPKVSKSNNFACHSLPSTDVYTQIAVWSRP